MNVLERTRKKRTNNRRVDNRHIEGCTLEVRRPGLEGEMRDCRFNCSSCGWYQKVIDERKNDELYTLPNGLKGYVTFRKKNRFLNGTK